MSIIKLFSGLFKPALQLLFKNSEYVWVNFRGVSFTPDLDLKN